MKNRIMTCAFPVFFVLLALVHTGGADPEEPAGAAGEDAADSTSNVPNPVEAATMPEPLAHAMADFRSTAELARKQARENIVPKEEVDQLHAEMARLIEEILDHIQNNSNAIGFLKAKGLDTIIAPNLHIPYPELRKPMLKLISALFNSTPTATADVMPNSILDRLVDIFERSEKVDIATLAIEILSVWLPGNPAAQIRVLKMKGFQPFYRQLEKMEWPVPTLTLQLFNKLIDEHMIVRNKKIEKNAAGYKNFKLYQQIGLIERLSTPEMCAGLLSIFQDLFAYELETDTLPALYKLVHTIKPHCYGVYSNRPEVKSLLTGMLNLLHDRPDLEKVGINVTATIEELTDFIQLLEKKIHTEL